MRRPARFLPPSHARIPRINTNPHNFPPQGAERWRNATASLCRDVKRSETGGRPRGLGKGGRVVPSVRRPACDTEAERQQGGGSAAHRGASRAMSVKDERQGVGGCHAREGLLKHQRRPKEDGAGRAAPQKPWSTGAAASPGPWPASRPRASCPRACRGASCPCRAPPPASPCPA